MNVRMSKLSILTLAMLLVAAPITCEDSTTLDKNGLFAFPSTVQKGISLGLVASAIHLKFFKKSTVEAKRLSSDAALYEKLWYIIYEKIMGQIEVKSTVKLTEDNKFHIEDKKPARGIGGWCDKNWKEVLAALSAHKILPAFRESLDSLFTATGFPKRA